MLTFNEFKIKYQNNEQIAIAVIGDSTTGGFCANNGINLWTNGLPYACVNQPRHGENLQRYLEDGVTPNPVYINTVGTPTQEQQDNIGIPSAVRLLRTAVETRNNSSKVYNYGGSGYTASTHISFGTVATVANLVPKPDVIFFNLGINSAKNNESQDADLRTLVAQSIANDMLPILVKPNNVGVADSPSGSWRADSCPDNWYLMDNWQSIRDNIQQIADVNGLEVIDLGADNTLGDITLLYDSFHPSTLGHKAIFDIYNEFLESSIADSGGGNGYLINIRDGKVYQGMTNGNGAFKIKISTGDIIALPLTTTVINYIRIKVGVDLASFA
jgi:lysophospholipase L1-like esterase